MTLFTPRFQFPYPEGTDSPNGPAELQALAEAIEAVLIPAGTIVATARATAPTGWLMCDGSSVQRSTYADLFTAIGTSYGSVDGLHFTLPNLKGRAPVGQDAAQTEFASRGQTGGEKTHVLSEGELASHSHSSHLPSGWLIPTSLNGLAGNGAGGGRTIAGNLSGPTLATDAHGGNQPHNNIQPYQVVNYMIKI
jgi:microcystin-dependent protein